MMIRKIKDSRIRIKGPFHVDREVNEMIKNQQHHHQEYNLLYNLIPLINNIMIMIKKERKNVNLVQFFYLIRFQAFY